MRRPSNEVVAILASRQKTASLRLAISTGRLVAALALRKAASPTISTASSTIGRRPVVPMIYGVHYHGHFTFYRV